MASLIALPEELLDDIASYLAKDDLCAMRLSSKRLTTTASYFLFSTVRLYPSPGSIEKYYAFLESPHLSKAVRHVYLNTIEENAKEEEDSGQAELSNECRKAFGCFNRFPNLKSASLRFSNNATSGRIRPGDEGPKQYSNWPETVEFRQPILDQFFRTLADPAASNVTDVSIRNLQNINDPELVSSKHFNDVMSRLTSLRLYIVTEHFEEAPEEEFRLPELYTFMSELVPTWLSPCSATLTRLSLYSDQYFGYLPLLDLRPLRLPRLHTLALGNYTISHAWQLDWFTSHCPTLRHLHLDDCAMIHYFQLYAQPDASGYITSTPPTQDVLASHVDRPIVRTSPLRWSHLFARLRARLPSLRRLLIGSSGLGGWHHRHNPDYHRYHSLPPSARNPAADPSHPRVYARLPLALYPDRYLICHMGIGPNWYTDLGMLAWPAYFEAEDGLGTREGEETEAFIDALEEGVVDGEDRDALVGLLRGIGQVGEGDDDVEVEGMMARGWGWRDASLYGCIGPRSGEYLGW